MNEIGRVFREHADLDRGPILPFDEAFAAYEPLGAHHRRLLRQQAGLHRAAQLPAHHAGAAAHAPASSGRAGNGPRPGSRTASRAGFPPTSTRQISQAASDADAYIAGYNIWMHHLVDDQGARLFPPKLRLLTHWNLRDEIKADYGDAKDGLAKQRTIQKVMERIVTQTIPQVVIDNPAVDWNPWTERGAARHGERRRGEGARAATAPSNAPEPDTRYARLLDSFHAERRADPYSPLAPTLLARRFNQERELPEARVKAMLEKVAHLAARPAGGEAHRAAAGTQARALRHLVQRLQGPRLLHRGAARCHLPPEVPDRRRPSKRTSPGSSPQLGFRAREGARPRRQRDRGSGPRLRARAGQR